MLTNIVSAYHYQTGNVWFMLDVNWLLHYNDADTNSVFLVRKTQLQGKHWHSNVHSNMIARWNYDCADHKNISDYVNFMSIPTEKKQLMHTYYNLWLLAGTGWSKLILNHTKTTDFHWLQKNLQKSGRIPNSCEKPFLWLALPKCYIFSHFWHLPSCSNTEGVFSFIANMQITNVGNENTEFPY